MENVKLNLSMQDVSRILNALVTRPYMEVADLIENLKSQIEWNAREQAAVKSGAAQSGTGAPATPPEVVN